MRNFLIFCVAMGFSSAVFAQEPVSGARSRLPSRAHRVEVMEQAGLSSEISHMDELDKDVLYMKAEGRKLSELRREFPQINVAKLRKLQRLVRGSN